MKINYMLISLLASLFLTSCVTKSQVEIMIEKAMERVPSKELATLDDLDQTVAACSQMVDDKIKEHQSTAHKR